MNYPISNVSFFSLLFILYVRTNQKMFFLYVNPKLSKNKPPKMKSKNGKNIKYYHQQLIDVRVRALLSLLSLSPETVFDSSDLPKSILLAIYFF